MFGDNVKTTGEREKHTHIHTHTEREGERWSNEEK